MTRACQTSEIKCCQGRTNLNNEFLWQRFKIFPMRLGVDRTFRDSGAVVNGIALAKARTDTGERTYSPPSRLLAYHVGALSVALIRTSVRLSVIPFLRKVLWQGVWGKLLKTRGA